jgi:hypothetical protein
MTSRFLKLAQTVFAGAVVLALPAYAVCSLAVRPIASDLEIARADDPIRNGFRVVERPASATTTQRSQRSVEEVTLSDWVFTSKGNTSPYR